MEGVPPERVATLKKQGVAFKNTVNNHISGIILLLKTAKKFKTLANSFITHLTAVIAN